MFRVHEVLTVKVFNFILGLFSALVSLYNSKTTGRIGKWWNFGLCGYAYGVLVVHVSLHTGTCSKTYSYQGRSFDASREHFPLLKFIKLIFILEQGTRYPISQYDVGCFLYDHYHSSTWTCRMQSRHDRSLYHSESLQALPRERERERPGPTTALLSPSTSVRGVIQWHSHHGPMAYKT